jgi:hypothetical protein
VIVLPASALNAGVGPPVLLLSSFSWFLSIASNPIALRVSAKSRVSLPNLAFDPGHGPASDPTIRRDHSIGRPPLVMRPGPCRSMLALGPAGAPTQQGFQIHSSGSQE